MVFGYSFFNDKVENDLNNDFYSNGYVGEGAKHGHKQVQRYDEFYKKKSKTYANYLQERCAYLWHGVG
jgi:hypothetical protein